MKIWDIDLNNQCPSNVLQIMSYYITSAAHIQRNSRVQCWAINFTSYKFSDAFIKKVPVLVIIDKLTQFTAYYRRAEISLELFAMGNQSYCA